MGAPKNRGYKRSWKNLLLDKRYQLRFTLMMVGVSALLMLGLGWKVMGEAAGATQTARNNILGTRCPAPPELMVAPPANVGAVVVDDISEMVPDAPLVDGADPAAASPGSPGGAGRGPKTATRPGVPHREPAAAGPVPGRTAPERPERRVVIEESSMALAREQISARYVEGLVRTHMCRMNQAARLADLREGHRLILMAMIGFGLLLVLGLTVYGVKMTHRVAGPLFKISLYFEKMKDGRFDTVYNLRKGDQLIEFYEHFKAAHAGMRAMQQEDIEALRAVLEVAEREQLASRSPELAAVLEEMKQTLADKEASLE